MKAKAKKKGVSKQRPAGSRWPVLLLFPVIAAAFLFGIVPVVAMRSASEPELPAGVLLPAGIYLCGLFAAGALCLTRRFQGDRGLVAATFLLAGLGVAVQLRMGTYPSAFANWRGFLPLVAGLVLYLFLAAAFNAERLRALLSRLPMAAWLLAVGILAALLMFGKPYRGGIFLPGRINPTEVVKPLLVIFLAGWLSARREAFGPEAEGWLPPVGVWNTAGLAVLWGIPMVLGVLVKDLGLVLLLNMILVLMLTASSKRLIWLVVGVAGVVAAGYAVQLLSSHAATRFDVWLDPFKQPTGKGWQILQSLTALYSGGFLGAGIGSGMPHAVPIVTSDFIYAAFAEEAGLLGCAFLLLAYLALLTRGLSAAAACRAPFLQLLGAGLTAALMVQIALNIGGVVKALPMTGITLPFISYGGFSLITTFGIAGLLTAISNTSGKEASA